jgi:spore germination protein YaaH
MGIPYYGWDWAVEDGRTIQSRTLPADDPNQYAAVISYARAKENKDIKNAQCQWDEYALSTWCWYTDEKNVDHQVWLEDTNSIKTKFTSAKEQAFSGIAIWTLGYDKGYSDLWTLIENIFE